MTSSRLPRQVPSRRDVVRFIGLASASLLTPFKGAAATTPTLSGDPFEMLGVASGDPTADGVVLWCRLALDLQDGAQWGMSEPAYEVRWELRDLEANGQPVVQSGSAVAEEKKGYALHVEVTGLKPSRRYSYRFMLADYGDEGVTQTAPAPDVTPEKLRFAFCSCAEYENGFYYAYEFMARDEPAFIVHLGDYIYERTYDEYFRRDAPPPPVLRPGCEDFTADHNRVRWLKYDRVERVRTLSQYRRRYAEYKRDPNLKYAHRHCPFVVTWDDHEVENDYASDFSEIREATDFVQRRIDAYKAYFENLPIRLSTLPVTNDRRQLYRAFDFGRLARLYMLDERQYRADQACPGKLKGNGDVIALSKCAAIEDGSREMLGLQQMAWLDGQLRTSNARWNILAQGVMMAPIDSRADCRFDKVNEEPYIWTDAWSGYPAARQRVIDLVTKHASKNPVVLSGDIHAHFVNRILADWKDAASPTVAPEFVCGAISSNLRNLEPLKANGNERSIVDLDCRNHGYVLCDVTKENFEATMVNVSPSAYVSPMSQASTKVGFKYRVKAGDPEPRKVVEETSAEPSAFPLRALVGER